MFAAEHSYCGDGLHLGSGSILAAQAMREAKAFGLFGTCHGPPYSFEPPCPAAIKEAMTGSKAEQLEAYSDGKSELSERHKIGDTVPETNDLVAASHRVQYHRYSTAAGDSNKKLMDGESARRIF
jgi:hypothetical protein